MLIATPSSLQNTFSFLHAWLSLLGPPPLPRSQKVMLFTGSVTYLTATDQTLSLLQWGFSV